MYLYEMLNPIKKFELDKKIGQQELKKQNNQTLVGI